MNPARVTPLILTWNEEDNIERCLTRLAWAADIVVIDSGSTDGTLEICSQFPAVRVVQNRFESFAEQTNFGLTQINTDWVLSIDADYILPMGFEGDLKEFDSGDDLVGAYAAFDYCVFGRPLESTLYPPRLVLHRVKDSRYVQDGHAHRVEIAGNKTDLGIRIDHDDRKPLPRWFASQASYARQEAAKLLESDPKSLSRQDRLRRSGWASPWIVVFWCLVIRRCALDGWDGLYYTFQRMIAETMLAICILDARLRGIKK